MNKQVAEAAERLAEVLARENAALNRMDYPAAVALMAAKEAALSEMTRDPSALPATLPPPVLQALGRLAEENRILLERAIEVQTRVVRIVARAVAPTRDGVRYQRPDEWKTSQRTMALAVSKRV